MAQNDAMSVHEYRDDDDGYMEWLHKNPNGYVINIQRSHSATDAHVHDASCSTLKAPISEGLQLTHQYVKVCGRDLVDVQEWTASHLSEPIPDCGICRNLSVHGERPVRLCPGCSIYELSGSGKCPSCDEE